MKTPKGLTEQQWAKMTTGLEASSTTLNDYRKVLNLLHDYNDGQYHILTMNKDQAKAYYDYLDGRVSANTLSANTAHRYKATLRSLGMRIARNQEDFPNYKNPFTQLVKNEFRKPTSYDQVTFANPQDIQKIRSQYYTLRTHEVFILELMLNLGLTPRQIEQIKISDFQNTPKGLVLSIPDGPDSKATYLFYPQFEKELKKYQANLGESDQDTNFFVTSRHLPYSYRPIHHLVQTISKEARLEQPITPYQLSLYGMVHAYYIHDCIVEHSKLDQEYAQSTNEFNRSMIKDRINDNERIFIPLAKRSWIGDYQNHYPKNMLKQIHAIQEQLGQNQLLKIVGLKND